MNGEQASGRRRLGVPGQPRPDEHLGAELREDVPVTDPFLEQWVAPGPRPVPLPVPEPQPGPGPVPLPEPEPGVGPTPVPLPVPEPEPWPGPSDPEEDPTEADARPSAEQAAEDLVARAHAAEPHLVAPRAPEGLAGAGSDEESVQGPPLRAAIEAVLMVVDEPVTATRLAEVVERPRKEVTAELEALAADYDAQGRGFELRFVAGGWRFYTRAECAGVVEKFVLDGQQARLTQAALETLAVIAYRQPVSRSRVSAVRGVNCDGVMRTLVQRGLVEESGTEPETGAILYRTTHYFLERMGLRGLDELPELAPFLPEADDVEADSQEGSAIAEAVAGARQQ